MRFTRPCHWLTALCCAGLLWAHAAGHVQAQATDDVQTQRLQGLTRADLERLTPQLQRGPVGLIEFADTDADQLPAINLAAYVEAPAATLAKLISTPGGYPRFVRTLDRVEVIESNGNSIAYDWSWDLSLFHLQGRNMMTVYEPPASAPERGYRITIDCQSGDLGTGRMLMKVIPVSATRSMLVLSTRIDLRTANYIARQMAAAARSINRSANMSLAYAMLLSFRRDAEKRPGHTIADVQAPELSRPALDKRAVLPLLTRGDLVLFDMTGDRLDQVAIVGLINKDTNVVREVMTDADAFGASLVPGSHARVVSRNEGVTRFEWGIDLPLVGVSGHMHMTDDGKVTAIDAVEGAMRGGQWRFEATPIHRDVALVTGWARFNLADTTWLLRSMIDTDPYLGHGMTAASEVMLVRALRSRSHKRDGAN